MQVREDVKRKENFKEFMAQARMSPLERALVWGE